MTRCLLINPQMPFNAPPGDSWIRLGLAHLSSVLKAEGHEVSLIDFRMIGGWREFRDKVTELHPDIVFITAFTSEMQTAIDTARTIKSEHPKTVTCIGGIHASIAPEDYVRAGCFDYIIRGEGEITVPKIAAGYRELLIQIIDAGHPLPHVTWGETPDLNSIPFADRELWPDYAERIQHQPVWLKQKPWIDVLMARGCPHKCLAGDTLIDTTNGKFKIKDLVGKTPKVLTRDPVTKKPLYALATIVAKTGTNKKLVRVSFREGGHIDCTPDHKFVTFKNGNQSVNTREYETNAANLKHGDSVRAIHYGVSGPRPGYVDITWGRHNHIIPDVNHVIENVVELIGVYDTYCMEVPGYNWFYANDVLVHNCKFCSGPGEQNHFTRIVGDKRVPYVRGRSVDNVIRELTELDDRYHYRSIHFDDDQFIMNTDWTWKFMKALKDNALDTKRWWAGSRADVILRNKDLVLEMRDCGMEVMSVGFESFSDELLQFWGKGTTVQQNFEAAQFLNDNGIKIFSNTIMGAPRPDGKWHIEDDERNLAAMKRINPAHVSWSIFTAVPGSELYQWCIDKGLVVAKSPGFRGADEDKIKGINHRRIRLMMDTLESTKRPWYHTLHDQLMLIWEGE